MAPLALGRGLDPGEPAVRLDQVSLAFRGADRPAVDRVSLQVHRGELLALLGPSGAGKTTLLRLIAGFECP
ncbi:MAG TPA: ATP-binding cassette domain-containing protein, partial [Gemmatimonadales bacterium]|nr:ATP-binding cassette domain-containing protein [Gemmatimonadales bacterium]